MATVCVPQIKGERYAKVQGIPGALYVIFLCGSL